ncbi:hypothetical protein QTP88_022591 [Uroleucon formosanum]
MFFFNIARVLQQGQDLGCKTKTKTKTINGSARPMPRLSLQEQNQDQDYGSLGLVEKKLISSKTLCEILPTII